MSPGLESSGSRFQIFMSNFQYSEVFFFKPFCGVSVCVVCVCVCVYSSSDCGFRTVLPPLTFRKGPFLLSPGEIHTLDGEAFVVYPGVSGGTHAFCSQLRFPFRLSSSRP